MATAPALMSIEQYLHTAYKPDVHFVDGELEERNVGESDHAQIQWTIAGLIFPLQAQSNVTGRIEQRIRVSGDCVRICDVAVLSGDAPYERVVRTPPLVCIEILSPEDRLSRALKVLEDYRAMGVPHIWLLDPQERLAYTFEADGLKQQQDLILRAGEIVLDVRSIFAGLDRGNAEDADTSAAF